MPTPPLSEEKLREAVEALEQHGTPTLAAAALGIPRQTLNHRIRLAARKGSAPGHFEHGVAPGYAMGKVTVQRGPDGTVERTWERQSPDAQAMFEAIEGTVGELLGDLRGALPPVEKPGHFDEDLLTVIPMGDPHFGLLTWAKEVGEDFNLEIAEDLTFAAVDRLCSLAPPSHTALLLNLGDFFHADDSTNRTRRSGNVLDVDGRFQKIAQVGLRALVRCIRRLLERHAKVIVRNNPGNHDPHQAYMLSVALGATFHDEPRVEVDTAPGGFFYYRFGKVLIGSTHGDGAKLTDLPMIMADDRPEDWYRSTYRVWHCGHFHHDQIKDMTGCTVETHRTLAPNDAWHNYAGYRSKRGMKAIVYHREFGEDLRIPCSMAHLRHRSSG